MFNMNEIQIKISYHFTYFSDLPDVLNARISRFHSAKFINNLKKIILKKIA